MTTYELSQVSDRAIVRDSYCERPGYYLVDADRVRHFISERIDNARLESVLCGLKNSDSQWWIDKNCGTDSKGVVIWANFDQTAHFHAANEE